MILHPASAVARVSNSSWPHGWSRSLTDIVSSSAGARQLDLTSHMIDEVVVLYVLSSCLVSDLKMSPCLFRKSAHVILGRSHFRTNTPSFIWLAGRHQVRPRHTIHRISDTTYHVCRALVYAAFKVNSNRARSALKVRRFNSHTDGINRVRVISAMLSKLILLYTLVAA